jgi:hypothetical protein
MKYVAGFAVVYVVICRHHLRELHRV